MKVWTTAELIAKRAKVVAAMHKQLDEAIAALEPAVDFHDEMELLKDIDFLLGRR
jgi:hypothetical protein